MARIPPPRAKRPYILKTVRILKLLLGLRGLPVSGKKEELIDRLAENDGKSTKIQEHEGGYWVQVNRKEFKKYYYPKFFKKWNNAAIWAIDQYTALPNVYYKEKLLLIKYLKDNKNTEKINYSNDNIDVYIQSIIF